MSAELQSWVGKERRVIDDLSPTKARALSNALAREEDHSAALEAGDQLPPGWQWLYFLDTPNALLTGSDGHAKTGDFLPPAPLPRRMWAAGRFAVEMPLVLGVPAERRSVVSGVDIKNGSTGQLVFVTVNHNVVQDGRSCIEEEQTIVYREIPDGPSPLPAGKPAPDDCDWSTTIRPDPILLFRFSALTYNAHRIHYDRHYAVDEEHYPALVVHSPLQAILLANSVQEHLGSTLSDFSFRAQRPLFDTDEFRVCGKVEDESVRLWTRSHDGFIATSAEAKVVSGGHAS